MAAVVTALPGHKKFLKFALEATAREDKSNALASMHVDISTTAREALPYVLNELAQAPANGSARETIVSVKDRLKAGDPYLELKFTLDSMHGVFDEIGVSPYFRGRLLIKLAEQGLPQLRDAKPEDLTLELLETVENYGLQDYVRIYRFFNGVYRAKEAGERYARRKVGFRVKPAPDEVSAKPFEDRLKTWERSNSDYRQQRVRVAHLLSVLEGHSIHE